MRFLIVVLLLASGFGAYAQFPNIKIDQSNSQSYPPCEPSISIDLNDTNHIVAGAILNKVYTSLDGGRTWGVQSLSSKFGVFGDPCIVSGAKGRFYYFHLSDPTGNGWSDAGILDRIVCQRSKKLELSLDGPNSRWSKGASIGLNAPKDQDKEWSVFDFNKNKIYCTWTEFDKYNSPKPEDKSRILFSSSNKRAQRWKRAVQINELSGDCLDDDQTVEGAVPTVDLDGNIYVTWALGDTLYFDRSFDGGKTWLAKDKRVTQIAGGWALTIPGINRCNGMPITFCDVSTGPFSGRIYVQWSDQRGGQNNTDAWIIYSDDKGDTWSNAIRLNQDKGDAHQFFTWATLDRTTGHLYAVYYDRREAPVDRPLSTDVYLAYSRDGGITWGEVKISESPFEPNARQFFGDYNNIVAHSGMIRPIWTRLDDGQHSIWTALINAKDLP